MGIPLEVFTNSDAGAFRYNESAGTKAPPPTWTFSMTATTGGAHCLEPPAEYRGRLGLLAQPRG
ncbi:hypothetical protein GCM10010411_55070 [Actinomadura fulvescens]|uniref:Uncharacterized protein n=1 Tax=Actinomadura fulvescens TaxID=46160 RepID=A0ABP6CIZ6_9ACTN